MRLRNHGEEEEIGMQRMYLGRSFLQVLVTALSNNVFPVIVSLGEAMMRELCDSILSLANCPDATSVKQSFLLLHKMINNDNNKIEFLFSFLIDSAAQVALQVPLSAHFDPNDAQWSLAQHEGAILLSGLRSRYPDNVIPLINRLPPLLASTMDNALAGLQGKELDRQLEKIYREIRSGL